MKSLFCATSVAALMLTTSGCAALTHYNSSDWAYGGHTTHFIDAKQRIVSTGKTRDRETGQDLYMVCAEPSPDALSAIAAAQGLSLSKDDIQAAFSNSITEGAGSIGLRTQSIQLMRDSMYRLCEAHMSGFIGDLAFETLHRRFQSSMVAILAIEQLTSVARPPAITLGGISGGAGVELVAESSELMLRADRDYQAAVGETKKAKEAYDAAEAALKARQPAEGEQPKPVPEGEPTTEALEKDLKDKKELLDKATKREGELKEELEYFQSARRAALAGARTEIRVDIEKGRGPDPLEAERVAALSKSVEQIVESTLTLSFTDELCTTVLVAAANGQLYRRNGDDADSGLNDAQLKRLRPINDDLLKLVKDVAIRESELSSLKLALARLTPGSEAHSSKNNEIGIMERELAGQYAVKSEMEWQRSLIIGPEQYAADGSRVISNCNAALSNRADAELERWATEVEWKLAKIGLLDYAMQQDPTESVALIDALARWEAAKPARVEEVPTPQQPRPAPSPPPEVPMPGPPRPN